MSENAVLYQEYIERINIIQKKLCALKRQRDCTDDNIEYAQLDARILSLRETISDMRYAANRLRLYI